MSGAVTLFGWIAAALAAGWLGFEATRPPPSLPEPVAAVEPIAPELPELAREVPLLSEFKVTLDRPLFSQDRRPDKGSEPADAVAQEVPGANGAPGVRLTAVIVDAEGRSALLYLPQQAQAQRVPLGGTIAGWRVEQIRDDAVVLRNGAREAEVALRTFGPARPAAPANAEPAPAPRRLPQGVLRRRPVQVQPGLEADEPLAPDDGEYMPRDSRPTQD